MSHLSQSVMIQGGREIFAEDIDHICTILEKFPGLPRSEIIATVCETLEWLTPAGNPKLDACTKLLCRLEEDGVLHLPIKATLDRDHKAYPRRVSALTRGHCWKHRWPRLAPSH